MMSSAVSNKLKTTTPAQNAAIKNKKFVIFRYSPGSNNNKTSSQEFTLDMNKYSESTLYSVFLLIPII